MVDGDRQQSTETAAHGQSASAVAGDAHHDSLVGKLLLVAHSIRCGEGGRRREGREPGRSQLLALKHINASAGGSVGDLARALSVSLSNASNLADKLELRGWARRRRTAADQRAVLLYPTRAGVVAARSFASPSFSRMELALRRLPERQTRRLEEALDAVLDSATELSTKP